MKMTAKIIQKRLAIMLDYCTNVVVPNTNATGYEADLLCLMRSGFLDEYEIKISVSDLKREFAKDNRTKVAKHRHLLAQATYPRMIPVRRFSIVLPEDLVIPSSLIVPAHIGIVRVPIDGRRHPTIERKPKLLPGYRKLFDNEQWSIVRLGYIRYWKHHFEITNDVEN